MMVLWVTAIIKISSPQHQDQTGQAPKHQDFSEVNRFIEQATAANKTGEQTVNPKHQEP